MKRALVNGVAHFQRVQRQKKQRRTPQPPVLGDGQVTVGFLRDQFDQETAVRVGPHRRESSMILDNETRDRGSRSISSSTSSMACARRISSSAVTAGCTIHS